MLVPGIIRYDFPSEIADKTVKFLNKKKDAEWQDSQVGSGFTRIHIRSSMGINLELSNPEISDKIKEIFLKCLSHYLDYFDISVTGDEGLQVLKYKNSDKYEYHSDSSWESYRTVSVLIYLNPKEYTGGETHFKFFDLYVKPDTPSIVIFPSDYAYLHSALPVKTGTKYVIVTWLSDKK